MRFFHNDTPKVFSHDEGLTPAPPAPRPPQGYATRCAVRSRRFHARLVLIRTERFPRGRLIGDHQVPLRCVHAMLGGTFFLFCILSHERGPFNVSIGLDEASCAGRKVSSGICLRAKPRNALRRGASRTERCTRILYGGNNSPLAIIGAIGITAWIKRSASPLPSWWE